MEVWLFYSMRGYRFDYFVWLESVGMMGLLSAIYHSESSLKQLVPSVPSFFALCICVCVRSNPTLGYFFLSHSAIKHG